MVVGGVLTVYLQQQAQPEPVETGDAVLGGLLAGLVGAVIASLVGQLLLSVTGPMVQEQIRARSNRTRTCRRKCATWSSGS